MSGSPKSCRAELSPEVARARAAEVGRWLDELLQRAQRRQLQEETRGYLVDGLARVLVEHGFCVEAPQLARAGDLESAVVLRAARPDRRGVVVRVPPQGTVEYEVEGFARRTEATADGAPLASCDEAEHKLEEMHRRLDAEFGVRMGPLTWAGKPPLRLRQGARELPGGGGTARRESGGAR